MGGRMARGSSLSDDAVIQEINQDFIAVNDNVTEQGFPPNMPALARWERSYQRRLNNNQEGFTTTVILTPDGQMALGTSGTGFISERYTSTCYLPDKYLQMLLIIRDRYRNLCSIMDSPSLSAADKQAQIEQIQQEIRYETRSRIGSRR